MIARNSTVTLLFATYFAAATGQALAYDCSGTQDADFGPNWDDKAEIRTAIENRTSDKGFEVTIYRNDNEKAKRVIDNTNRFTRYTMNVGDMNYATQVAVKLDIKRVGGGSDNTTCAYTITYNTSRAYARWALDNSSTVCGDITDICEDCAITCENKYVKNAQRWTTTFAICDFLDKECEVAGNLDAR